MQRSHKRSYFKRHYWQILIAIAIAINTASGTKAHKSPQNAARGNLRERLTEEWSNAVQTDTLRSPTAISALQFSPDGQLLASLGTSQITIWNLNQGKIQRILPGHYASKISMEIAPTAIAFSPDSRFIATSSWSQGLLSPDQAIIVRDTITGEKVLGITNLDGCRQILFDVSGEIIYGACGLGVTAWSFPEGKELFSFDTEYPVETIAQSPQGLSLNGEKEKIIATVDANVSGGQGQSKQIQLWQLDQNQGTLIRTLDGHENELAKLEFTADGKKLVSSSYDGKINVWNWQQGTTDRNTNNLYSDGGIFSLSANSQLIAGNFHSSIMTNLITGLPLRNVIGDQSETSLIAFSPQDSLFAKVDQAAESNTLINLWRTNDSPLNNSSSKKTNYNSIPLAEHWSNQQPEKSKTEANKPYSIGKDLKAIALSGLGFDKIEDLQSALTANNDRIEIQQDYPHENLATVTITQTRLSDDSVEGYRHLVEFAPYGEATAKKWQVVWAGEQFRCWSGRGHQDWGTDLCH